MQNIEYAAEYGKRLMCNLVFCIHILSLSAFFYA